MMLLRCGVDHAVGYSQRLVPSMSCRLRFYVPPRRCLKAPFGARCTRKEAVVLNVGREGGGQRGFLAADSGGWKRSYVLKRDAAPCTAGELWSGY